MGTSLAISRRRPAGLLIHALPVTLSLACLMLVLASETQADGCCFTGGPSVRVSPNARVEIRWTANFVGDGKVEIFDHPNGGVPIDGKTSPVQGAGHTIEFSVGGVLHPDTTHYPRARPGRCLRCAGAAHRTPRGHRVRSRNAQRSLGARWRRRDLLPPPAVRYRVGYAERRGHEMSFSSASAQAPGGHDARRSRGFRS